MVSISISIHYRTLEDVKAVKSKLSWPKKHQFPQQSTTPGRTSAIPTLKAIPVHSHSTSGTKRMASVRSTVHLFCTSLQQAWKWMAWSRKEEDFP